MGTNLYNNEAESLMLAALLRNPESYFDINSIGLTAKDFANKQHQQVMEAILAAVSTKSDPTVPYVIENLRENNRSKTVEYVGELQGVPCSVGQAKDYAKIIKSLAVSRDLQDAGARIIGIASEKRGDYSSVIAEATKIIRAVEDNLPIDDRSPSAKDILQRMEGYHIEDRVPISFSQTLQSMTGGLARGHFWVIGGFSSTGKSAFSVNLAADCLARGKTVAIVSAEMTQEQYMTRLLAVETGFPTMDISNKVTIGIGASETMVKAKSRIAGYPLYIFDNLYRMPQIRTEMQRLKNQKGVDIFILDYIQNVSVTGDEISDAREVALECQRLAKDLDCTVVAFSQLSNAQAQYDNAGGDENYYSLKGHGSIRDAADVILTLHRDRVVQSSLLKVKFRKNRHGPMSDFRCFFDLKNGRIEEMREEYED